MPLFFCDSAEIQTRNLLIRSQMLYSVKLRNHHCFPKSGAKILHFSNNTYSAPLFLVKYAIFVGNTTNMHP